jgi:tol-pal system protein YbgF
MKSHRAPTLVSQLTWVALLAIGSLGSWGVSRPAAAFTAADDRLTNERIAELERRVLALQKQATVNEVELARLRDRVIDLENELRLEREARAAAPARPAPWGDEEEIQVETPGRIEEEDLDEPVRVAEQVGLTEEPEPATVPAPDDDVPEQPAARATASQGEGLPVPAAGQEMYDQGYTLYHQGQYVEAEAAFQRFLATYGDTELADNALYWIGESRYARGDHRGALAAFREAVERYPKGNKVPDALLKAGAALEKLGDVAGARQSYRDIERRFPDSATALIAAERIARLP